VSTWSVDAEFGFKNEDGRESGFVPVVFCALNLDTGDRYAFWGRDSNLSAFLRDRDRDLFISHNLIAEAKYLLRLGVKPPERWFDTMLAWRYVTNAEIITPYGLLAALTKLGLPYGCSQEEKQRLQQHIGCLHFGANNPDELRLIRAYCWEDCAGAARLYQHLAPRVPLPWMQYVSSFCLELARMELQGVGIDMPTYDALLERREEVVELVTSQVNAMHAVFRGGQLVPQRFFAWCAANGVGWPSKQGARGLYLPLDSKTFKQMKYRHPFIRAVYEAKKTVTQLNQRTLVVDPHCGRHFFGNIPFGASTGRTTFRGFLLSSPKWMRWLAVPRSPDHLLVEVDFEAEEILIAAYLSHDERMREGYASGDPHIAFAVAAGAVPAGASKATHAEIRALYKTVNLAVNYGQTASGIALTTGMHTTRAQAMLAQHKRAYPAFWDWSNHYTTHAIRKGVCHTLADWPRKVSRHDNPRSIQNYPVQGTGGDLMRLATVYLSRHGLQLLATNHDGFLLECQRGELPRLREAVDAALHQAVQQLMPGAPMRWTTTVYADRYQDDAGRGVWELVKGLLGKTQRKVVPSLVH
jgi:DNA polymerase I-like protein with 3'-5' exonuclease and polymerase domains